MEIPTRYEPAQHEGAVYAAWKASGGFAPRPPRPDGRGTFTVAIPPPNVTGILHMGHALNNTVQDIVVRHRRMAGFETLWVPGTDHAGIATQAVWLFPILDMATDMGLSGAVIQRDSNDPDKISSVFWMNVIMGGTLFLLLVGLSPLFAAFSGHAVVGYMLIAYGTKLLWQNVYFIPIALMRRELRFKELSIIRIIANVAEFVGKIGFAWAGFGGSFTSLRGTGFTGFLPAASDPSFLGAMAVPLAYWGRSGVPAGCPG
jgi:hypothetical protein